MPRSAGNDTFTFQRIYDQGTICVVASDRRCEERAA